MAEHTLCLIESQITRVISSPSNSGMPQKRSISAVSPSGRTHTLQLDRPGGGGTDIPTTGLLTLIFWTAVTGQHRFTPLFNSITTTNTMPPGTNTLTTPAPPP